MQHKGFALLDIISPCVTFNNHDSSTKSYDYIRDHNEAVGKTDFVPLGEEISTSYKEGSSTEISLHDGSKLALEKTDANFDPRDAGKALNFIREKEKAAKALRIFQSKLGKNVKKTTKPKGKPSGYVIRNYRGPKEPYYKR